MRTVSELIALIAIMLLIIPVSGAVFYAVEMQFGQYAVVEHDNGEINITGIVMINCTLLSDPYVVTFYDSLTHEKKGKVYIDSDSVRDVRNY
jgi:hypothetical protein